MFSQVPSNFDPLIPVQKHIDFQVNKETTGSSIKETRKMQNLIEPNQNAEGLGDASPSSLTGPRLPASTPLCLPTPSYLGKVCYVAFHSLYPFLSQQQNLFPSEGVGEQVLQVEVCSQALLHLEVPQVVALLSRGLEVLLAQQVQQEQEPQPTGFHMHGQCRHHLLQPTGLDLQELWVPLTHYQLEELQGTLFSTWA